MEMMARRQLRADAARNVEQILAAAHQAFAEDGSDVSLETIARRAGVGIRTLHRHFPQRGDLVRAVLDRQIADELAPAIDQASEDDDPLRGLTTLTAAAVALVAREMSTLAAARHSGFLASELSAPFFETMATLVRRGQQANLIRVDLVPEDLPRLMTMIISVLWNMDPATEGWRRYLGFILDGLSPAAATIQPPPAPTVRNPRAGSMFS